MSEFWVIFGAWLSAGLMLAIYSFLYADNPFFKMAEHFYIGVSVGYAVVLSWYDYLIAKFYRPLVDQQDYWVLVPAVLGLLIFTRYIPKVRWMSRLTFAAVMGWTAGVAIPRRISEFLLAQIYATIKPLVVPSPTAALGFEFGWTQFNALLVLIGVLAVLVHFFFSIEHRGPIRVAARVGVLYLMVAFGAAFGSTTMARMSLLYGRADALREYSKAEYYHATPILLAGMLVGLVLWRQFEKRVLRGKQQSAGGPPDGA